MKSKTKINKGMKKKTDKELAETIFLAKKVNQELASEISKSTRDQASVNVEQIEKAGKDSIIVPGKVLGLGKIDKKVKVYALKFSKSAEEKLSKAGAEFKKICDALKEGDKIQGEILR
jgi:large subunit ribosomal protein L18e